jgi:hypothetical protein
MRQPATKGLHPPRSRAARSTVDVIDPELVAGLTVWP